MPDNEELIEEIEVKEKGFGSEYVTFIPRPEVKEVTVRLKQGQVLKVEIV